MCNQVLKYFYEICKIPRETYHVEKIKNYLVDFAKKRNLEFEVDSYNNVMIIKKAKDNNSSYTILQSHIDMVCQKEENKKHDFRKDEIKTYIEDGYIKACGTTLGADDGIGVAMMLAILDSETDFGNLKCIFTADEEVGMDGAINLKSEWLDGDYLINLHSEEEGIITLGCAGGVSLEVCFPIIKEKKKGNLLEIRLSNLLGGHSGVDIDKDRINAITFITKQLDEFDYDLISIDGGIVDNAICNEVLIKLFLNKKINIDALRKKIEENIKKKEDKYNLEIKYQEKIEEYFIIKNGNKYINYLKDIPDGVISYEENIKNMVETSINLGNIHTFDKNIVIHHLIRSSKLERLEQLVKQIKTEVEKNSGKLKELNSYPGWEFDSNSNLLKIIEKVYFKKYNKKIIKQVIHAGLECGVIKNKNNNLDCVSIGPNIFDVHTPNERVEVDSIQRVYELLIDCLLEIKG